MKWRISGARHRSAGAATEHGTRCASCATIKLLLRNSFKMTRNYIGSEPEKVLKEVFGYASFRPLQKEIISNVLGGKDSLAIMPTGGGKSLCYQIPALIFEGITVVVSPLISLMQDQVDSLAAARVEAVFLNSTLEWENYLETMNSIRNGEIKILYVSPEGLSSHKIIDLLHDPRVKVSCITIDEAHCVSEWGHDFRPEFLEIANVRRQFPEAVCLALTATATAQVREDIISNLALKNPSILVSSFDRPNIFLCVRQKSDGVAQVVECIRRHWDESGVIYCFSRKQVDSLAEKLVELGYSALNYHAGLSDDERRDHQNKFIRDQVQIMVATLAFGMGIDKPNVRFVIHYNLPKSLEQYYQEIGRAGRDGLPSEALLLYSGGDIYKIRRFFTDAADPKKSEMLLQSMVDYAQSRACRRKALLSYFGEKYEADNPCCCDICRAGPVPLADMTVPSQKLMSCIIRTNSRFGANYVVDVLTGARNSRIMENGHNMISTWGIGTEMDKRQWLDLVSLLIEKKYLVKTGGYGVLNLTREGLEALRNRDKILLPFELGGSGKADSSDMRATGVFTPKERSGAGSAGGIMFPKPAAKSAKLIKKKTSSYAPDDSQAADIFSALKKWRRKTAEEMNVPPYVVFGDKTLNDIASKKPQTISALRNCYGIGESKAEKFGEAVLSVVCKLC